MDHIILALRYGGVFALLVTAVVQDLRSRQIKNVLCLTGVALGLALALLDPNTAITDWLFGLLLSFALGFLLWMLGMFCAGDAKIFCVVGACWGAEAFANCFVCTVLVGGVFSLLYMIIKGELKIRLRNVFNYFKGMITTMSFKKYSPPAELDNALPFSVFILLGAAASLAVNII